MAPFLELPASSSDAQADLGTSNKAVLRVFECCYMILAALTARLRTPAVLARLSTSGLVTAQNGNRNHGGRAPTPCAPSKLIVFVVVAKATMVSGRARLRTALTVTKSSHD
jgi:hypothetical protein